MPVARRRGLTAVAIIVSIAGQAMSQEVVPSFEGSALLVLSDTDIPASAFVDGRIIASDRDRVSALDKLTIVSLPIRPSGTPDTAARVTEVDVSNSVVGPPYGMAVSANGRFAYVLETRGRPPEGVEAVPNVFTGLPTQSHLTVVDLTDKSSPRTLEKVLVASLTHTVSLRADGRMLAINTDEPGRHIVLRRVGEDGRLGEEALAFGIDVNGKPLRRVGRVEWHPSGRFLAMGLPFEDEIRFYEVAEANGRVTLRPWGDPVKVGDFADEGAFTPDGRHYISTDLHWGDRPPPNYLTPPNGTFTAIRFDVERGRHIVTGRAPTSISPEGIAISPDGRFVVAANLERSFMPWGDARLTMGGSLDLLTLDPQTGGLRHIANYRVAGILPEGLAFDKSGGFLAATVFDHYDPLRRRGTVEFWRLIDGQIPRLERTNYELEVAPGPHTLVMIP